MLEKIYDRQKEIFLKRYGKVVLAGCGGVGSWTGLFLAMSGCVGKLILVDPDVVEISNLNRTPYKWEHIGENKAHALRELIIERRPAQTVYSYSCKIEDISGEIERCNLFLDCRDSVDSISEKSPILAGYDKDAISLSVGYKNDFIFDSGLDIHGYTGAWIIPPVMCASFIVLYILRDIECDNGNKTINLNDLLKNILRGEIMRIIAQEDERANFKKVFNFDPFELKNTIIVLQKEKIEGEINSPIIGIFPTELFSENRIEESIPTVLIETGDLEICWDIVVPDNPIRMYVNEKNNVLAFVSSQGVFFCDFIHEPYSYKCKFFIPFFLEILKRELPQSADEIERKIIEARSKKDLIRRLTAEFTTESVYRKVKQEAEKLLHEQYNAQIRILKQIIKNMKNQLIQDINKKIWETFKKGLTAGARGWKVVDDKVVFGKRITAEKIKLEDKVISIPEEYKDTFYIQDIIFYMDGEGEIKVKSSSDYHPNADCKLCIGDLDTEDIFKFIEKIETLENLFKVINLDSCFPNDAADVAKNIWGNEEEKADSKIFGETIMNA